MCNDNNRPGVRRAGACFTAALTGLVAGYCLAFLLGRSVWLEMRVNIGHALPVSTASFLLVFGNRKRLMRLAPFLLLQLLAAILLFSTYGLGWPTVLTVPASLFREGFHLNFLPLSKIDLFLFSFLGAVNVAWIYRAAMERRSMTGRCRTANH